MIPGYKLFGTFSLYYTFHVAAFAALFAFLLVICKKYSIKRWKTCIAAVLIYISAYAWMLFLFWASTGFTRFGGQNIVRIFIWLPVFTLIVCKLLKINWQDMCDMVAPCLTMNHGIAHIACIFEGCCYGYEISGPIRIYNAVFDKYLFPIQILESAVALGITAYLIHRMRKANYETKGEIYPIMLILFGYTRFFLEFGRNNEKLFLGISGLAIHALIAGLVGTIWLMTVKARQKNRKENH